VNLPVLAVHRQGRPAEISAAPSRDELAAAVPTLDGCHVLLVDDAPDARNFLLAMLLRIGARVTVAHDAPTAFLRLRELRPNVIVSDIEMPSEDGHSLIRRIRALSPEEGGGTPAIALTANNRFADRMRAFSAGFQIHITKPVEPDELAMVIANLQGQSSR
jgi:CheY-like chemotaxis protein